MGGEERDAVISGTRIILFRPRFRGMLMNAVVAVIIDATVVSFFFFSFFAVTSTVVTVVDVFIFRENDVDYEHEDDVTVQEKYQ